MANSDRCPGESSSPGRSAIGRHGTAWAAVLSLLAFVACGTGCGPAGYRVSGAVSFADVPVDGGTISFVPADGNGPTFGGMIKQGRYEVVAPTPGQKIVRVSAVRPTGRKVPPDPLNGDAGPVDEIAQYIPEQYNDRSTLTCDVVAGPNSFDFHLKSP